MVKRADTSPVRHSGRAVSRLASFGHALRGLTVLLRQPNARIHVGVALVVVALAWALQVSVLEWCALALAMALVLGAEALNTAIELVVDMVQPEWHAMARDAKDVAAAGVLLCSLGAAVVGLCVFAPRLWALM
jgi:diacylglycerol kinase